MSYFQLFAQDSNEKYFKQYWQVPTGKYYLILIRLQSSDDTIRDIEVILLEISKKDLFKYSLLNTKMWWYLFIYQYPYVCCFHTMFCAAYSPVIIIRYISHSASDRNNKINDIDLNESASDNGDLTHNSIQNIST